MEYFIGLCRYFNDLKILQFQKKTFILFKWCFFVINNQNNAGEKVNRNPTKKIITDIKGTSFLIFFICLYIGRRIEKQLDRNDIIKHEENRCVLILNKQTEIK